MQHKDDKKGDQGAKSLDLVAFYNKYALEIGRESCSLRGLLTDKKLQATRDGIVFCLKKRYSDENWDFIRDLYTLYLTIDQTKEQLNEFVNLYLKVGAKKVINLSDKECKVISDEISHGVFSTSLANALNEIVTEAIKKAFRTPDMFEMEINKASDEIRTMRCIPQLTVCHFLRHLDQFKRNLKDFLRINLKGNLPPKEILLILQKIDLVQIELKELLDRSGSIKAQEIKRDFTDIYREFAPFLSKNAIELKLKSNEIKTDMTGAVDLMVNLAADMSTDFKRMTYEDFIQVGEIGFMNLMKEMNPGLEKKTDEPQLNVSGMNFSQVIPVSSSSNKFTPPLQSSLLSSSPVFTNVSLLPASSPYSVNRSPLVSDSPTSDNKKYQGVIKTGGDDAPLVLNPKNRGRK